MQEKDIYVPLVIYMFKFCLTIIANYYNTEPVNRTEKKRKKKLSISQYSVERGLKFVLLSLLQNYISILTEKYKFPKSSLFT